MHRKKSVLIAVSKLGIPVNHVCHIMNKCQFTI